VTAMARGTVIAALAGAVALAGCGGGSSTRTHQNGQHVAAAPLAGRHAPGAPTQGLPAAGQTCKPFVAHTDDILSHGARALAPGGAAVLFGELDGLSRRLGGVEVEARYRRGLDTLIARLGDAASAAGSLRTFAPGAQVAPPRKAQALERALARANAAARALGLRDCVIAG
jgi:hypothetical protein